MSRYGYVVHSELAHHGILGQRWGKRNGPPYPLDASDHSAQEKKLNGGRYTQGVKQDRSGKSSAGKGKKELTPEEKAERARKIKKGLAIGAGVAGAAAATAGAIYLAKHPETAKAALSGVKDLAVNAGKNIRTSIKTRKLNESFKNNAKTLRKEASDKLKQSVKDRIKSAKHKDWKNTMTKKVNKKREKTGLMKDVTSDHAISKIMESPHLLEANKDRIISRNGGGTKGQNKYQELVNKVYGYQSANNRASQYTANKKRTTGIKGVVNKVWKPVTATAGVIGTVGGTARSINNGINDIGALANNPYAKKAYKAYMNSGYDDYYDYNYNQNQNKKKKKS